MVEKNRTRIAMRGVKLEMSGCIKSLEKLLQRMNTNKTNFNEWRKEKSDLMK